VKVSECPLFIQQKLNVLSETADEIEHEAEQRRKRLEHITAILRDKRVEPEIVTIDHPGIDYRKLEAEFRELTEKVPVARGNPWDSYKRCRQWIEKLQPGTSFEEVTAPKTDSADLGVIRSRIARAQDAVDKIRRLPTPAGDIEERLRAYVASLDTLSIGGIQDGEQLVVSWGRDTSGWPKEPTPLQVEALLRPDGLVSRLMGKVERMALGSAPPSERPARIRALESEIEELEFIEERLVMQALDRGEPVERRSDASPAAVLQARVVVAKPAPTPPEKQQKVRVVA
jgi:hypothetical protein